VTATVWGQDEQLVEPFVQVAAFKAHPTYLDLANLRFGTSSSADQDAELYNCLLLASAYVENFCQQPIQGHVATDNQRVYPDRQGRLFLYPDHAPVRTVLSYSSGRTIAQLVTVTSPPWWPEDGRQIMVEMTGAANVSWTGSLSNLGGPVAGVELLTSVNYVAGYANATLTATANQAATSISVTNPTAIFAGDILRLWDPGLEESVIVAPSWAGQNTSPYTSAAIPLVSPLVHTHAAGVGVTGFDGNLTLATIYFTVDGLQRWGTSSNEWPKAKVKSATGKRTEDATAWEQKAMRLLLSYRRSR